MDVPASLRTQILSDLTLTTSTHHRSVTATQLTTTTTRATRNTTNLCITNLVTRQSTLAIQLAATTCCNAQPDQPVQHQPCIQMSIPHVRCPPDHVFVRASSEAGTRLRSLTKKDQQQHIRAIHGNMSNIRMIQKRIPDDRSLDYIQTNIAQQIQELGFELWIATVDFQSAFEPVEHRSVQEAWEETKSWGSKHTTDEDVRGSQRPGQNRRGQSRTLIVVSGCVRGRVGWGQGARNAGGHPGRGLAWRCPACGAPVAP